MKPKTLLPLLAFSGIVLLNPFAARAQAPDVTPAPRTDDAKLPPYKITHGDTVSVAIFGETDLPGGGKRVESNGTINLPLIGDIRIAGLTKIEAQAAIERAYIDGRFL